MVCSLRVEETEKNEILGFGIDLADWKSVRGGVIKEISGLERPHLTK